MARNLRPVAGARNTSSQWRRLQPERTAAQHQSLLHFVGEGNWSDEKILAKVREMVLPAIERHGPVEAWIIDDTGFPKKGSIRSELRGNIAASLASKTIVRSP
jgi:SRSO17 transposase